MISVAGNLVAEKLRPRLVNKFLMPEFKIASNLLPKIGNTFNATNIFPDFNAHKPFSIISGGDEVNDDN